MSTDIRALYQQLDRAQKIYDNITDDQANAADLVADLKRQIEQATGIHPDKTPRHRHLRRVVLIPAGIGGAAAVARETLRSTTGKSMTASAATIAVGAAAVMVGLGPGDNSGSHDAEAQTDPPAATQPPGVVPSPRPPRYRPARPASPSRDADRPPQHHTPRRVQLAAEVRITSAPLPEASVSAAAKIAVPELATAPTVDLGHLAPGQSSVTLPHLHVRLPQ